MFCVNCGSWVEDDSTFCDKCGSKADAGKVGTAGPAQPSPYQQPQYNPPPSYPQPPQPPPPPPQYHTLPQYQQTQQQNQAPPPPQYQQPQAPPPQYQQPWQQPGPAYSGQQAPVPDQTLQKAQELGQQAWEGAKVYTGNASDALKILMVNPLGGLDSAYQSLGEDRATQAGIAFIVANALVTFIFSLYIVGQISSYGGLTHSSLNFGDYLLLLVTSIIPALALVMGFFLVGKLFGGQADFRSSIFATGSAMIPSTITLLLARLVGLGNFEVIALVSFFGVVITILLLNGGVMHIQKLPERKAIFLTPLIIIVTAFIIKIVYVQILISSLGLSAASMLNPFGR